MQLSFALLLTVMQANQIQTNSIEWPPIGSIWSTREPRQGCVKCEFRSCWLFSLYRLFAIALEP